MADNIQHFQDGREAAIAGDRRDGRKTADWLEGYDAVRCDHAKHKTIEKMNCWICSNCRAVLRGK